MLARTLLLLGVKLKEGVSLVWIVGMVGSGFLESTEMLGFESVSGDFDGLKGEVSNAGAPTADVVGVVNEVQGESGNDNGSAGSDIDFFDDSAFF